MTINDAEKLLEDERSLNVPASVFYAIFWFLKNKSFLISN